MQSFSTPVGRYLCCLMTTAGGSSPDHLMPTIPGPQQEPVYGPAGLPGTGNYPVESFKDSSDQRTAGLTTRVSTSGSAGACNDDSSAHHPGPETTQTVPLARTSSTALEAAPEALTVHIVPSQAKDDLSDEADGPPPATPRGDPESPAEATHPADPLGSAVHGSLRPQLLNVFVTAIFVVYPAWWVRGHWVAG